MPLHLRELAVLCLMLAPMVATAQPTEARWNSSIDLKTPEDWAAYERVFEWEGDGKLQPKDIRQALSMPPALPVTGVRACAGTGTGRVVSCIDTGRPGRFTKIAYLPKS